MPTNQTPEELAEECKRLTEVYVTVYMLHNEGRCDIGNVDQAHATLHNAITRLRDMAASGAKDADSFEQAAQPLMKWLGGNVHPHHTAVVTSTDAELLEGKQTIRTPKYVKD